MAVASLITGLLGISPAAIILGHIALSQIKKSGGRLTGFGLALAGTILGYVGLAVLMLLTCMSVLFVGARAWKKGADRAGCMLNTRNVQQAVRGHQIMKSLKVGDPIDWNDIFGPEGYLSQPVCPMGGTYTFVDTYPPDGTLAVSCSHADHVPADHSDW
ncbi:MAG TPA: DUF4190 domain-containing protein [Luteolibacter sp.]|nr:DUF4190 domain-containing protein [Luteolibacter sp.]